MKDILSPTTARILFSIAIPYSNLNENDKYSLDINYNYSILRELWSILLEIYQMRIH